MKSLMKVLAIGLVLSVCVSSESMRVKRADCSQVYKDFDACGKKAYQKYRQARNKGQDPSDEKADFEARKVCNYMIEAVETCGNQLIGECVSEEQVTKKKDKQLRGILKQVKVTVANWDTEKCPATKAHIERIRAADPDPAPAPSGKQQEDLADPTKPPAGGAGALAVPTALVLIAAAFV